jgi:DNA-binding beta-propeller fold protein YncE
MADNAGNVFIVDKNSDSVLKVTADGRIHTVAGTHAIGNGPDGATNATRVAMNTPNGLWVRGDGTVYVLDTGNSKVRRLDTNGMMKTLFVDSSGINGGRGLWVKSDESLVYYASGTKVRQWTPAGGTSSLNKQFNDLGNLILSGTNLIATDRGDDTVWLVATNQGTRTLLFGMSGGTNLVVDGALAQTSDLYGVRGIWQLPAGGYFLGTDYGAQFLYVDGAGIIHLFVNGQNDDHAGDGQWFYAPTNYFFGQLRSVSMDNRGNLIIVENDLGYVRQIDFQRLSP